jgi:hypothetical protein
MTLRPTGAPGCLGFVGMEWHQCPGGHRAERARHKPVERRCTVTDPTAKQAAFRLGERAELKARHENGLARQVMSRAAICRRHRPRQIGSQKTRVSRSVVLVRDSALMRCNRPLVRVRARWAQTGAVMSMARLSVSIEFEHKAGEQTSPPWAAETPAVADPHCPLAGVRPRERAS